LHNPNGAWRNPVFGHLVVCVFIHQQSFFHSKRPNTYPHALGFAAFEQLKVL
jgi:hypothetical protein